MTPETPAAPHESILEKIEGAVEKVFGEVTSEATVLASDIEAVLKKYEMDVIGKATNLFADLKALATKAKTPTAPTVSA